MIESNDADLTFKEVAWNFVEVFDDLEAAQINEILIKNVPLERLKFFNQYANEFSDVADIGDAVRKRVPNLMLIGYLLRVLEERLLPDTAEQRKTS
ncbi:MAG TPA: hypothetical protein EYG46_00250 [Myxococcales bacterium]|nr:hypothetical protein [Myxococcales bacterium]